MERALRYPSVTRSCQQPGCVPAHAAALTRLGACQNPPGWCTSSMTSEPCRRCAGPGSPWWSCSPASSTRASPRRSPPGTSRSLAEGRVVATFDVDALHDYRARRPPVAFVRDHYEGYEAPAPGRPRAARRRRAAVPPAAAVPSPTSAGRASPRAVREVVERFDVRRVVEPGRRPDGRAAHPADRGHPARQPPELLTGREPVARRAARARQRPVAAGDPAGGVGPRRPGLSSRTSRTTSRRWSTRRPRSCCSSSSSSAAASRSTSPSCARRPRSPRPRSTNYLAVARRRQRGRARPRAAVRRLPRRRGVRQPSLLAADEPLPTGEEIGAAVRAVPRRARRRRGPRSADGRALPTSSSSCSSWRTLDVDLFRGRQADTVAPARLRWPGGRAVRRGRHPHGRGRLRHALAALLLPAPRRHGRADHLRRRAASATAARSPPGG